MENTATIYAEYEQSARFIRPYLPASLIETYEQYIKDKGPAKNICKNYIQKLYPDMVDFTLENTITAGIYFALSKEDVRPAISSYREIRRLGKKNFFLLLQQELGPEENIKPRNPRLLQKNAEAIFSYNHANRLNDARSVRQIMEDELRNIEDWRGNTTLPITNFPYLYQKSDKNIATAFMNDITLESLLIIHERFDDRVDGYRLQYPESLSQQPIMNYNSRAQENFIPEMVDNELILSSMHEYDDEDVKGTVEIQYRTGVVLQQESAASLPNIAKEYGITSPNGLDMTDNVVLTYLFSELNAETLATQKASTSLKGLIRKVYHEPARKNLQEDLINRLWKIRSCSIIASRRNEETGTLITASAFGLLDSFDVDVENDMLEFRPSEEMMKSYVQKKYTTILSESYKSIHSAQTRGFLLILQQARLVAFKEGENERVFTLKFFRRNMRFHSRVANSDLSRTIHHHLTTLQESNIVVKEFEFINKNSAVRISFLPMIEDELIAYGLDSQNVLSIDEDI